MLSVRWREMVTKALSRTARLVASPAAHDVNGQLFIVYGPTVTLVAAPTVEAQFSAESHAWDPADLTNTLQKYFAGRDPQRNFSASELMG